MRLTVGGALVSVVTAAPAAVDLGEGLRYFRVHEVPADLPAADTKPGALVVDLRNSRLAPDSAAALAGWLRFRAAATTPLLVLVNDQTAPEIGAALTSNRALPGLLTVGLAAPGFTPDLLVAVTAAADQRAYEAFEHGTALSTLVTENADKPRSDEASIMRERANPPAEAGEDEAADDTGARTPPDAPAKPPAVIDSTLQKAVQVHRALRALKRL